MANGRIRAARLRIVAAPVNTGLPSASGTATEGQTLTADVGTWTNSPSGFAYQWLRGGVDITGATLSTYLLTEADVGANMSVRVTATNIAGSTAATSATVGPVADSSPDLPSTQTVAFGSKTRCGHGGHAMGYTGAGYLGITAGNTGSAWAIDSHNKLVLAGTYGSAPPSLSASYTLTVTEYSDVGKTTPTGATQTTTVNVESNRFYITDIPSGTNADTASSDQLKSVLSLAPGSGGPTSGDRVRLRDGARFNRNKADVRIRPPAHATIEAAMTGGICSSAANDFVSANIADASWIIIEPETQYGARIDRVTLDGTTRKKMGFWFRNIDFACTYDGADLRGLAGINLGTNTATTYCSYVRFSGNRFRSNDTTDTQLTINQVARGIYGRLGSREIYIHDNEFDGLLEAVEITGSLQTSGDTTDPSNIWIIGNSPVRNIWNDHFKFASAAPVYIRFNLLIDKKYGADSASGPLHGDFVQFQHSLTLPGTYAGGDFIGNILARGDGTATYVDGQGYFQTAGGSTDAVGVSFTNTRVMGNFFDITFSRGITVTKCASPTIAFNTMVEDAEPGIVNPGGANKPGVYLRDCTGTAVVAYNAIAEIKAGQVEEMVGTTPSYVSDVATGTNVISLDSSVELDAAFVTPTYGANLSTADEVIAAWSMEAAGTLSTGVTGFAHKVGALGTGYVDFANRTTSFPAI